MPKQLPDHWRDLGAFIREQRWEAAVLPFGATEPHNLHMPYGTDNLEVEAVGQQDDPRVASLEAAIDLLDLIGIGDVELENFEG